MFVFVIAIRHPDNMASVAKNDAILERTILSILHQTSSNYKIVVVCNKEPDISVSSEYVEFAIVNFSPPGQGTASTLSMGAHYVDKGSKYCVGLIAAKKHSPEYIMFLDYDDFVSRHIVEYTEQHNTCDGWVIDKGFMLGESDMTYKQVDLFHHNCGTSNIVASKLLPVPPGVTVFSTQDQLFDAFGRHFVRHLLAGHRWKKELYGMRRMVIQNLPFRGAIYLTGTGENHSGVGGLRVGKCVDKKLQEEFGLPQNFVRTSGCRSHAVLLLFVMYFLLRVRRIFAKDIDVTEALNVNEILGDMDRLFSYSSEHMVNDLFTSPS